MNFPYSIFPNNNPEASYNPVNHLITLNSISEKEFEDLKMRVQFDTKFAKGWSIYMHEFMHWFDHISTLQGQINLKILYNAFNVCALNNESEFWRIKLYFDTCRLESCIEEFIQIDEKVYAEKLERWKPTVFVIPNIPINLASNTERPFLFSRYHSHSGFALAQMPISISPILEARAVYSEYRARWELLNYIEEPFPKAFAQNDLKDELINLFQEPSSILYNSISHLTSAYSQIPEQNKILELAYNISNIALNMPLSELKNIKVISRNKVLLDNYYKELLNLNDIGFHYYNLLDNFAEMKYSVENNNRNDFAEAILRASNLPEASTFNKNVIKEMEMNLNELIPGPFYKIASTLLNKGIEIFKRIGVKGSFMEVLPVLHTIIIPRCICGDTDFFYKKEHFNLDKTLETLHYHAEIPLDAHYFLYEKMFEKCSHFDDFY